MGRKGSVRSIPVEDYYKKFLLPRSPRHTDGLKVVCPFHADTDPSFHLRTDVNRFKCFGCGVGGDVVQLHILTRGRFDGERLSEHEAMLELADLYGFGKESLSVQDDGTVISAFQRARDLLNLGKGNSGVMTFSEYRELNRAIGRANSPRDVKIMQWAKLDLRAICETQSE